MTRETLEQFEARGGTITRCEPTSRDPGAVLERMRRERRREGRADFGRCQLAGSQPRREKRGEGAK